MGSFITRNYMCRSGTGIAAAVVMGTGMQPVVILKLSKAILRIQKVFWGSHHVSRLMDKLAFGSYNKRVGNVRTPFDWLSRDAERVDRYISDSMCGFVFTVNGFNALFELIARLYRRESLKQIPGNLPVYMVSGTDDPVGDYGKGVQKAYDSLKEAGLENMELKLYEGGRHELMNETNRAEVMQDIYEWLKRVVLRQQG